MAVAGSAGLGAANAPGREPPGTGAGDAGPHNLIPLRETFIADCETPVSAFLKLRSLASGEPCFLLESAEQGQRLGRYSFIGFRPRSVLRWSLADGGDPYALAAAEVARCRQAALPDLPPFAGGAVGFFGYDLVRTVEPLGDPPGGPAGDPLGLPDMALMLTDVLVVFDHLKHTVTILANADIEAQPDVEHACELAKRTIAEVRAALDGPVPRTAAPIESRNAPEFVSNMSRERFEAMVQRIVRYIHAGDAFQVVPSQRWSAEVPVEAFSIYRGLRAVNPSPYMYFLDFGDFQIAGASPEPLVTVTGREVSTRPIAGTRPRGGSPEEDRRIAAELLADEKERAEHVMLVDLGRNDLSRVCDPGSVRVARFMEAERYSHVTHLVSEVVGELRDGVTPFELLRACFPAGTVSGAPKVRAMQIISELEGYRRGIYAGAVGYYLPETSELDTCIAIRTLWLRDGVARLQAGGGIVADSDPAAEHEECLAKLRALEAAIDLAESEQDAIADA